MRSPAPSRQTEACLHGQKNSRGSKSSRRNTRTTFEPARRWLPEERVRNIALADINELFAKKRVKAAVEHDHAMVASESEYLMVNASRKPAASWKRNAAGWRQVARP